MMKPITLVMAYYDNPRMLSMQYDVWRDLPQQIKDKLRIILVDDGSPNFPAFKRDVGVPITIYRIGVDVRWNQDAARNIGMHHCETEWALLTDMDHIVNAETWDWVIGADLKRDVIYTFRRIKAPEMADHKAHPNSWLIATELFKKIWYDERFSGYYGTDGDFKLRALRVARSINQLKAQLIVVPREVVPDASTTSYTRKEPWDFENVKRIRGERGSRPALKLTFPYTRVA